MCLCGCCGQTYRKLITYSFATVFIVSGVILAVLWPNLSLKLVHKNLKIQPGTESYENWVEAPLPIYLTFSLFHWENPEDVRDFSVKPRFKEMGPYVFLEKHLKGDIEFHDNDTVSYFEKRNWYFDKSRSKGDLNDMITSAHVPSAVVAEATDYPFLRKIGNLILNREGGHLAVTKPAIQWIFDGFEDRLLDFLVRFNSSKIHVPYDKFGWLVERNGSLEYDGRFTVGTGVQNINNLGKLYGWNGSPRTPFYKGECANANGTTGDIFPPHIDTQKPVTIFAHDACRYMNLIPSREITHLGLVGTSFLGEARSLGGAEYPEQQCFCPEKGKCPKKGVVEVKKCRNNAPIYTSFPHFYLADESYREAVEGMNPEKDKHEFEIAVEPFTGIPLKIRGRLQINMLMKPYKGFDIYDGVQEFLMPLFWFGQMVDLDEEHAKQVRLAINLKQYGSIFFYCFIGLGVAILTVAFVLTVTNKWTCSRTDDENPIVDAASSTESEVPTS